MEDRISTLPEAIICHILSFLQTKEAAATSILSKRWTPLWLSVPTLHFNGDKSVYPAMVSRGFHQPIKTFRLKCRFIWSRPYDSSDVNAWIRAALRYSIEHLELSLPSLTTNHNSFINLPSPVLTCTTLVVLKLKFFTVTAFPNLDLPSLKILHLSYVRFLEYRYFMDIIFGCPVLEDLKARNIKFSNYLYSGGEFKRLPKLVRADIPYFNSLFKSVSNVEFLRLDEMDLEGNGEEMNLNSKDAIPVFYNLTHVQLRYTYHANWHEVIEVLKHCPKLQILSIEKQIDGFFPDDIVGEDWPYPKSVPECILSHLRTCRLTIYYGSEGEFRFVKYILQNARLLRTMTICTADTTTQSHQLKMIKELSLCTRLSAACKLSFE